MDELLSVAGGSMTADNAENVYFPSHEGTLLLLVLK